MTDGARETDLPAPAQAQAVADKAVPNAGAPSAARLAIHLQQTIGNRRVAALIGNRGRGSLLARGKGQPEPGDAAAGADGDGGGARGAERADDPAAPEARAEPPARAPKRKREPSLPRETHARRAKEKGKEKAVGSLEAGLPSSSAQPPKEKERKEFAGMSTITETLPEKLDIGEDGDGELVPQSRRLFLASEHFAAPSQTNLKNVEPAERTETNFSPEPLWERFPRAVRVDLRQTIKDKVSEPDHVQDVDLLLMAHACRLGEAGEQDVIINCKSGKTRTPMTVIVYFLLKNPQAGLAGAVNAVAEQFRADRPRIGIDYQGKISGTLQPTLAEQGPPVIPTDGRLVRIAKFAQDQTTYTVFDTNPPPEKGYTARRVSFHGRELDKPADWAALRAELTPRAAEADNRVDRKHHQQTLWTQFAKAIASENKRLAELDIKMPAAAAVPGAVKPPGATAPDSIDDAVADNLALAAGPESESLAAAAVGPGFGADT